MSWSVVPLAMFKSYWAHLSKFVYLNSSKIKVKSEKTHLLITSISSPEMKKRRIHWYICAAMLCYVMGFCFVLFPYVWWYCIRGDSIERNLRNKGPDRPFWKRMPTVMSQESEKESESEGAIWLAWCIDGPYKALFPDQWVDKHTNNTKTLSSK